MCKLNVNRLVLVSLITHFSCSMFCLGCASDVPKANDRRALDNPGAEDVAVVWRSLIEDNPTSTEAQDIDATSLVGRTAKMFPPYVQLFPSCE